MRPTSIAFALSTLLALLALVAGAASAQSVAADPRIADFENGLLPPAVEKGEKGKPVTLVARMQELGIPGLSVALIENGEVAWTRGYGVVDLETGAEVTPETLFLAGSISKPVAATAALRLVQEGKLGLDDDVNRFLRSWKVPPSEALGEETVTLRRLLTHTAGLTVHGFPGYARSAEVPTVPQILDGEKPANTPAVRVDLVPGSEWRYSGGGYTVMQLLVEEVAGEPFADFAGRTVLTPFGMTASSFENPLDESRWAIAASGYYPGQRAVEGSWHVYPEMAAAGLWTTAGDLARFAVGIQRAAKGSSDAVLDRASAQAMLTPHLNDWGLGPSLTGEGETRRFGHGGRDEGFDASLTAYVEKGKGAALLINANDNDGFLTEAMATLARVYDWPDFPQTEQREYVVLPETKLREYVGSWVRDDGEGKLSVFLWQGRLWASPQLGARLELLAEEEPDSFFLGGSRGALVFERDAAGKTTLLRFEVFGQSGTARRE